MIVYLLSNGVDTNEWFRTKKEAIRVAEAMQEPGAPAITVEKVWIGNPNSYNVIAYLNGCGFVINREIVKTWPAVEYSVEGEGSGDWSEADRIAFSERGRFRIIEKGEV